MLIDTPNRLSPIVWTPPKYMPSRRSSTDLNSDLFFPRAYTDSRIGMLIYDRTAFTWEDTSSESVSNSSDHTHRPPLHTHHIQLHISSSASPADQIKIKGIPRAIWKNSLLVYFHLRFCRVARSKYIQYSRIPSWYHGSMEVIGLFLSPRRTL